MGSDLLIVLLVILVLIVIWRGPKTLPKLGEALGRGVKEAKTEAKIAQAEIQARASGGDEASNARGQPGSSGLTKATHGRQIPARTSADTPPSPPLDVA